MAPASPGNSGASEDRHPVEEVPVKAEANVLNTFGGWSREPALIQIRGLGAGSGSGSSISLPPAGTSGDGPAFKPNKCAFPVNDKPPTPVRAHILLVEDHAPTRTALTQLLVRRRFKVSSAGTLAEARSLLGRDPGSIDLLISDIGLPDGNGCDLMQEVGRERNLKGIALTGFGREQDISRTHDAGFALHLLKPVNIEVLDKALATILG